MIICKICNSGLKGNGYCAEHSTSGSEYMTPKTDSWAEIEQVPDVLQLWAKGVMTDYQVQIFIRSLLRQQREEIVKEVSEPLKAVLDYVERWNKKDEERDVAEAATKLATMIK